MYKLLLLLLTSCFFQPLPTPLDPSEDMGDDAPFEQEILFQTSDVILPTIRDGAL
jgi:hypothetical protein